MKHTVEKMYLADPFRDERQESDSGSYYNCPATGNESPNWGGGGIGRGSQDILLGASILLTNIMVPRRGKSRMS